MKPQPLPQVARGRWVEQVREVDKAAVRAEIADLVERTGRTPTAALVHVFQASRGAVIDQILRNGNAGNRDSARLRASGALLRELRASVRAG
ncbi:hypothetical protein FHN55_05080 [Streptomyces sp. NP160]|uniref:hypothetical protein n=1 Tax=Streptomyces sp. NP160 TaxID=2586637 RepID=UPI0011186EE9|nr:hypothetical protein [Streptomyces sp. NP160]TNM69159.1 hypothetical protein FHN55_05080 [Streptomyces sp. NP160]